MRDRCAEKLYRILLKVRKIFDAFGLGTSVDYVGLDPGLGALEPPVLLRHGRESMEVLSDPEFEAPDEASAEQLREHAKEIAPAVKELDAKVKEHEDKKRESQMALKLKTQRLESCNEAVTYGARLNEAIFVLAGERFLAARLRPKVNRGSAISPEPFPTDGEVVDEGEPDLGSATPEETTQPNASSVSSDEETSSSDATPDETTPTP